MGKKKSNNDPPPPNIIPAPLIDQLQKFGFRVYHKITAMKRPLS